MTLAVQKLSPQAVLPKRADDGAAGYDLTASEMAVILPGCHGSVHTGLAVAVPGGTYGRVAPRSGLAVRNGIGVLAGVVDASYRGEVMVVLINHSQEPFHVYRGDRIAQLVLERIETPDVVEVGSLPETGRGAGGFGSTGR